MADRIALCIEPEAATAEQLRRLLEPNGFEVKNIPDGDDAMEWGRTERPAVIILSVEPKKIGYAICNKLRRSPSLREVPLVLISGEETLATFEQHRKLKSRADEYLLKPIDDRDLLAKVGGLLKLDLSTTAKGDEEEVHELDADSDIVLAEDDDIDIVSSASTDEEQTLAIDPNGAYGAVAETANPRDTSEERVAPEAHMASAPFEGEKFDPETQAAFAALEAGSPEGGSQHANDTVDLRNLWSDDDLPPNLGWEQPPATKEPRQGWTGDVLAATDEAAPSRTEFDPDAYRTGATLGPEPVPADAIAPAVSSQAAADAPPTPDEVPPMPDEVAFEDLATETGGRIIAESFGISPIADDTRAREAEARNTELAARIQSLENERLTLRKEIEEARERFTQSATFSKEREFLGLREIINKKEKDILDLRDALDAKERQILDHKDKIRELERARRDLEESTIGFEQNLVAANERAAELVQDRDKSAEREKGLRARLEDAQAELRKSHDEIDAIKKRAIQDEVRARSDVDRLRGEMETRLAELEEAHRAEVARFSDEHGQALASAESARQTELARNEVAHRAEIEALQRRLAEEQAQAGERLTAEVSKLRKEHEKAIAAAREEQAIQLGSERQSYEALTEQKERDHRNEILGMRRRHEEETSAAEDRRQRDIAEQEARRISELESAETRRRTELASRDEEHHLRVTEIERRHLTEKTDQTEKHRADYDQALGRAARAEGELAARIQEIEQAYRRLAGLEADKDEARAELGNREVRLAQGRDRIAELEAKVTDYEDQVMRAFQRIRADERTTEKTRRALAVALALLDERAGAPTPTPTARPAPEDAELKT
ncbi:MAG TPA: response regulator [Polyangia bacterium]|nr:response regulator [Polyangia bacterium]